MSMFSLSHNIIVTRHCTVSGGRVTGSMLMDAASFSGTVSNHGGKGLVSLLRKEAGKLGYGGNAAKPDVFWRVNAKGCACIACFFCNSVVYNI